MLSHLHIARQLIIASVVSSGHSSYSNDCSLQCQVGKFPSHTPLTTKVNSIQDLLPTVLFIHHAWLRTSWQDTYTALHTLVRIIVSQPIFANMPLHTTARPHNVLHSSSYMNLACSFSFSWVARHNTQMCRHDKAMAEIWKSFQLGTSVIGQFACHC